jgi:hypothetical protein
MQLQGLLEGGGIMAHPRCMVLMALLTCTSGATSLNCRQQHSKQDFNAVHEMSG